MTKLQETQRSLDELYAMQRKFFHDLWVAGTWIMFVGVMAFGTSIMYPIDAVPGDPIETWRMLLMVIGILFVGAGVGLFGGAWTLSREIKKFNAVSLDVS